MTHSSPEESWLKKQVWTNVINNGGVLDENGSYYLSKLSSYIQKDLEKAIEDYRKILIFIKDVTDKI